MNEPFQYTGTQVQNALDGLRAYGIAAGHPRAVVLDMCSEFKSQLAAQREDRIHRPKRPVPRNPFYKEIIRIFKEMGWDNVFYIIESRKGWRRVKFMEYHRTHSAKFMGESWQKIMALPRSIKPRAFNYRGWERLNCHGDYDAFVLGIHQDK